ncbi:putative transcriptional regulator [Xenococcus sp. PCC 7305]|uniref:CopG family ribbon-helix-helix protein n=1 Tax=Xenococcus sp. PCC 7305 TaxID=102125 RepID=UPI0002AC76AC|nr:CopG family ribbon-helix-helix protein [Xenococcus sp. PCC 7305]ELS03639.1 putative transcriptional regulator [Xenococcus sp. PCC 7305]
MTTTSFRLDDDLENQLNSIAKNLSRSKSWIINDALRLYIAREEKKQQMLRETEEALADLEAGRVVSGEEVMKWLETWGTANETKAPKL